MSIIVTQIASTLCNAVDAVLELWEVSHPLVILWGLLNAGLNRAQGFLPRNPEGP
jgi:hypothetical protein